MRPRASGTLKQSLVEHREIVFEERKQSTPVYDRDSLFVGAVIVGPAVLEQSDSTTVIEPGMHASVDGLGNLIVRSGAAS
jgi:N-methylhydantoinase A